MAFGARLGLMLVLGFGVGCGRSVRNAEDTGAGGSSGKGSGGTGSGRGGVGGASGAGARGGSSGTGAAGAGGEGASSARLFYETLGALVSTDLAGGELVEHCLQPNVSGKYVLVGLDGDRVIFFFQKGVSPYDTAIVRVALDGSECRTVFEGPITSAISPFIGGRIVFSVPPVAATAELELPEPPQRIPLAASGLASIRTTGEDYTLLAPRGVRFVSTEGERVVFGTTETIPEAFSILPDGTERTSLMPDAGSQSIAFVRDGRAIVNVSGDVYTVNEDGSDFFAVSAGPELDHAAGLAGEFLILGRTSSSGSLPGTDLYAVGMDGAGLVPLATNPESESFAGASGERVIFTRGTAGGSDLYSVLVDGTDVRTLAASPEAHEYLVAFADERALFASVTSVGGAGRLAFISSELDGGDPVVLHDDAISLPAVVDGRAVVMVRANDYDLVSVPLVGGAPTFLADSRYQDWLVGRLGSSLIVHAGSLGEAGVVSRVTADGSVRSELMPSALYVGAVTEACGAVPAGDYGLALCRDD
ncbi:MAG TPA: hypothetical protein VFZ53_21630 [Polyangiaceae bacterium]